MTAAQQLDLLHDLTSICDEGDVDKISGVMNRHFHSLEGARSLFCVENPKYHRDFLPETRTFGNSGYLHGFMRNRRILNVKNFDERSDFSNTFTISCDTQFPSYLRRRVCGRPIPNIDDAITECLQYLYHYRSGLDIQPYLFENQNRIDSTEVAESIQAYITFIYSHQPTLQASGRIVSTLPSVDIDKMTSDAIQMYKGPDWRILASHAKQNWSTTYAMLIVAAIVDIKHKKKDRSYKLACLMERIDKITVIPKIELHLVNRFFEKGTEEHFFRKVQRQVKNITSQLGNMAWDLSHKRTIFGGVTILSRSVANHADFIIPYMLTFDRPLITLLQGYQLNGLITYVDQTPKFLEIYPDHIEASIADGRQRAEHLFEPSRISERAQRGHLFNTDEGHRSRCIEQLEAELAEAMADFH
jgi:hypothetical protein